MSILLAMAFIAIQGIVYAQPVASFTANQTTGDATAGNPFVVQFTDTSTGSPISWQWNFGDGTANSTLKNPVHSYLNAGAYNVTLTVSDGTNYNTIQEFDYINVPLWVNGKVTTSLDLWVADLQNDYDQIAIFNHTYSKQGTLYNISASGASLNEVLNNSAIPLKGAVSVTFYGSDGFSDTIPLSTIYGDNQSMIATQWSTTDNTSSTIDGLRNILPSQHSASAWVYYLDGLTVN
jgi:PKD repeat protein